ncbi:hypothetical protein GUJ93_ZPchr0007g5764 [Zizania palustris]|uniref:Uncharacterized protein n=1 Tax=Zizania palustris TaxID=103762 RepID=A0A8J5VY55_ZIZPA|nr:hypothetical protein GUJ93_ZPchr0007g5764 [Zizania palustris]
MGGPLVDSSAKGVSSCLCLCHGTCERADLEHGSCACSRDGNVEAEIAFGQDDLVVEENEIAMAIAEMMHFYSDDDDEGTDTDDDSENEDPLSLESHSTNDLVDIGTELVTSPAFPSCDASESPIDKSDDGNSSINSTPVLVSAMKGSRAKRGMVTRLSVSWASDVYDPPVTSGSHTVKGHQRSSRKIHYKYKSTKSSSSRSSSSGSKKDKKYTRYSSSSNYKRDRKPSHRSANGGGGSGGSSSSSNRKTDTRAAYYGKVYTSSSGNGTDTSFPQYGNLSPLVPSESAPLEEAVPVVKTMEPIKRSSSCCKEQPFSILSRQFVAAKYKGMFSFWSQNQLAS